MQFSRDLILLPSLLLALTVPATAQDTSSVSEPAGLRVYLDCGDCDFDYLRREITFVNYVRDPAVAQVHVLVTTQGTGSGGTEYTLNFIGKEQFAGQDDVLRTSTSQTATEDEERQAVARTLRLGLVRYVAHLPMAERLSIDFEPLGDAGAPILIDPWNYWVFRTEVSTDLEGEETNTDTELRGSVSANRITDALKIEIELEGSYERSRFDLDDTTTFTSTTHEYDAGTLVAFSLSPHWSIGAEGRASSSTRLNQDLRVRLAPGIEYNWFPYSESSRRRLSALWTIGVEHSDYSEVTIFGEEQQTLLDQSFEINADVEQPWGSLHGAIEFDAYLYDLGKNSIEVFGEMDFRLFRGLELNFFGSYSRVRDQIYLPVGGATPEEILLSLRQLQTAYQYEVHAGLSYTFGSIYNNVVNPRFE